MSLFGNFKSNFRREFLAWKPHLHRTLLRIPLLLAVGYFANKEEIRAPMFTAATALGAWYPRSFCLWDCQPHTPSRDKIAVVLFDRKFFLNRLHPGETTSSGIGKSPVLPGKELVVSSDDYAQLLDTLAAAKVKAIIFDIIIDTKRHSADEVGAIAATIRNVKNRDQVPIIVAQAHDDNGILSARSSCDDTPLLGKQPPIVTCAASVTAPVDWSPPFEDWTDKTHFAALYYPHYVERAQPGPAFGCRKPGQTNTVLDPTPAWAAYLVMTSDADFCPGTNDAVLSRDLFLAWGRGETVTGPLPNEKVNTQFWWHLWRTVTALSGYFDPATSHSYIPSFSAADLDVIKAQLAGRAVFVGIDDMSDDDVIDVPQGGQMPGIFQHATALDNLLTGGPGGMLDLQPSSFELPVLDTSGDTIFMLAAVLLMTLAKISRERWSSHFGLLRRLSLYFATQSVVAVFLATTVANLFDVASARVIVVIVSLMIVDPITDGITSFAKE